MEQRSPTGRKYGERAFFEVVVPDTDSNHRRVLQIWHDYLNTLAMWRSNLRKPELLRFDCSVTAMERLLSRVTLFGEALPIGQKSCVFFSRGEHRRGPHSDGMFGAQLGA